MSTTTYVFVNKKNIFLIPRSYLELCRHSEMNLNVRVDAHVDGQKNRHTNAKHDVFIAPIKHVQIKMSQG